jgi:hypothetical protein
MQLKRCATCPSFIADGVCPTCGPSRTPVGLGSAGKLGAFATLLGSSAFAMTLMACYGLPPCESAECAYDPDASDRTPAKPTLGNDAGDASSVDAARERDAADANADDAGNLDASPDAR